MLAHPGFLLLALAPLAPQGGNPEVDPREAEPGAVCVWTAADGLRYEYRVPEGYDPDVGANLTVVLHGNGLDHRWTFWNHPSDEFRVDDVVVSPDGTSELSASNEFLGEPDDAERFHAFLEELRTIWNVRRTYLYGHSQGSFFVFYHAGAYPEDVDGVVGHASGAWARTKLSRKGHHQAIGVMHGTDDHVPYAQGRQTARWYRDEGYPLVHLRTLFDWPHRPHWMQAANVLAWCEGMTADDPGRVAASLETLAAPELPMGCDWSALWAVADRLAGMDGATVKQRRRARAVAEAVDALAAEHVESIEDGLGERGELDTLSAGPWSGELIRLLEELRGVPAVAAFEKDHRKALEDLRETGAEALAEWRKEREDDPEAAFEAALEALEHGFLDHRVPAALETCREWLRTGAVELRDEERAKFEELAATYEQGRADGFAAFVERNRAVEL